MGAFVVFDPYWDPLYAYSSEQEALEACGLSGQYPGGHYFWKDDAVPGDCSDLPYVPKPWEG